MTAEEVTLIINKVKTYDTILGHLVEELGNDYLQKKKQLEECQLELKRIFI